VPLNHSFSTIKIKKIVPLAPLSHSFPTTILKKSGLSHQHRQKKEKPGFFKLAQTRSEHQSKTTKIRVQSCTRVARISTRITNTSATPPQAFRASSSAQAPLVPQFSLCFNIFARVSIFCCELLRYSIYTVVMI